MDSQTASRIAAILLWLTGACNFLGVLVASHVPQALGGLTPGEAAIPLLLSALLFILAGFGLWLEKPWGRWLALVVTVLAIISMTLTFAGDFFSGALDGTGQTRWIAWVDFGVLLVYLFLFWLVAFRTQQNIPTKRRRRA